MDCSFEEFLTATDGHFTLNYEKLDSQNPLTVADKVRRKKKTVVFTVTRPTECAFELFGSKKNNEIIK